MAFRAYSPKPWTDILPGASPAAAELVQKLIVYESGGRMKAADVSLHSLYDYQSLLTGWKWQKQSFFK